MSFSLITFRTTLFDLGSFILFGRLKYLSKLSNIPETLLNTSLKGFLVCDNLVE